MKVEPTRRSLIGTGTILTLFTLAPFLAGNSLAANEIPTPPGPSPPALPAIDRADAFDVNDLNFLFPLGKDGLPYPEIKVTEVNGLDPQTGQSQGQIWPKHLFEEIVKMSKGEPGTAAGKKINLGKGEEKHENWRVVGVRFIPCVLSRDLITGKLKVDEAPGCVPQVRLVAQPFVNGKDRDVTVHLVYSLGLVPIQPSFESFVALVNPPNPGTPTVMQKAAGFLRQIKQQSRAIGVDTNGMPMQPHPGLVQELLLAQKPSPSLGIQIKTFVQSFTQPRTMTNISFMGLVTPGFEPWIFFGGDLGPRPQARPQPPAAFDESSLVFVPKGARPTDAAGQRQKSPSAIMLSFVDKPQVQPSPQDLSTAPLFESKPTPAAREAIFKIDNPSLRHNFNLDCVSCHTTTTRAVDLKIRSTDTDSRFASPPGISGFIDPKNVPRDRWNLRNFGHFTRNNTRQPTISTRTLSEIIDATHLMNDILARTETGGKDGVVGPGLTCKDERAVFNCTLANGSNCFSGCTKTSPAP